MVRYILNRLVAMLITLIIIISIAFCVVRLMPGNMYEQTGDLSQTVIDALNEKYHFDEPMIKQYGYYVKNIIFDWDWGNSAKIRPNVPVFDILRDRIPITLQINLISICWRGTHRDRRRYSCRHQKEYDYRPYHFLYGRSLYLHTFLYFCHLSAYFSDLRRGHFRLFTMFPPPAWPGGHPWFCRFWRWRSTPSRVWPGI